MAERVIREGAAREGKVAADIGPDDARCLLEAWLDRDGPRPARPRADRLPAVRRLLPRRPLPPRPPHPRPPPARRRRGRDRRRSPAATTRRAVSGFFEALVPAVPYAPSTAFLGAEKAKLASREGERRRVALIADGIGSMHGVTHTIEQIRERGVPGFEVDVIGTDAGVDRRLPAAAELELPFYEGMTARRPRPARPGRDAGRRRLRPRPRHRARAGRDRRDPAQPHHRRAAAGQLPHRAGRLRRPAQRRRRPRGDRDGPALGAFYGAPGLVLSPSPSADASLVGLGADAGPDRPLGARRRHRPLRSGQGRPRRLSGRDQGPLRRADDPREGGRPAGRELPARPTRADPRLHLLLAGGGPEEGELRARLGEHATFLGWLGGEELARAYASADVFLFASSTDTYGQVILEAGGQRPAGRRRRRGRPGGAGREPPHRPALPPRPRPPGRGAAAARLLAGAAPPARRRRAPSAARGRSWERAMEPARGRLPAGAGRRGRRRRGSRSPAPPERPGRTRCRSTMDRSTIPLFTSIASSPGSTSTSGFSNWPRTRGAAAGAAALLRHLRLQPRRVLHGPGRRPLRPARRRDRRPRPRRPAAERADRRDPGAGAGARPAPQLLLRRRPAAGAGGGGDPHRHPRHRQRGRAARDRRPLPRAGLPGADAAGDRPRPALPLHLQPLAQPRRAAARSRERGRDHRPRQGPEGAARPLPAARRGRQVLRAPGGGDRRQPRRPLPRHRGDRPRLLPGHPRRRLHGQRRGRRPPAGGPGRAAPPPLRRGRAAGDRRRDELEAARAADRRAAARRPRGLRRRRPDRPRRPQRHRRRARPRRAALPALVAGHAAAPAGRGRRAGRHVRGDPPARPARPPSLRLLRHLGRALRRAGRRRPRRAGDQAHRLPHQRRLAAGPVADPRLRTRQAGGLHGRAESALRRGGEHPLGEVAGGGRRPRRLRHPRPEDPRQGDPRRPPRGRAGARVRPHRHRQLPPEDGPPLHRLRPLHRRPRHRRRRRRDVQLPHRLRPPGRLPQGAGLADDDARPDGRGDRAHRRRPRGRRRGADRPEDELAGRRRLHPGALRGLAGGGAGRPQRARDLLPAAGRAGRLGEHPRRLDRRPLPRALARLHLPPRRRRPGC